MNKSFSILIFLIAIFCQLTLGQTENGMKSKDQPKARLYDEWSKHLNSEDRSARFDGLMNDVIAKPGSKAIIVFYCGKKCYYGKFEAHVRGIIKMKLDDWEIDRKRIVFIHGGYRKESMIRVWIVPNGAGLPLPEPTVKFEDVKFKGKYKHKMVAYDCCEEF